MAAKFKSRKKRKNQKGMATIEALPIIFIMVVIFNFSLGFFGAIHSGVLNSIASYNYAIETFRFKSNLMYFRPGGQTTHYKNSMNRVHGTIQEGGESDSNRQTKDNEWPATLRGITLNYNSKPISPIDGGTDDGQNHQFSRNPSATNLWKANSQYTPQDGETVQTPRIWIKTVYGICLTAECGE